eukprot:CAMPEP_0206202734 /NCGR_PEP_ID=MMETSP0166-20121206/12366_1 /ASSEMBLY_ACC=CAM_ASM_000260 /TAXON_ID=95228 /ORGANISM="Vannella robusta, Strain DIVA3 518/3/11/1/6" /LENGTH=980 /DNA_ID=CAMNT_0053621749 /DNA_START=454 /DNA_END=3392 /DNA_ORIENTATION=-
MACPGLWPCLKQIDVYLGTKNEAVEWFKVLQMEGLTTLEAAADMASEEWVSMKIPLRVLIELRALHKEFVATEQSEEPSSNSLASRGRIGTVEDISAFLNLAGPQNKEEKKKKPSTLRGKSSKPSVRTRKTLSMSCNANEEIKTVSGVVNVVGREDHPNLLVQRACRGKNAVPFNPNRSITMGLEVYGKQVDVEIRTSSQTIANGNLTILVFARNSMRSFTKMLDKYFRSTKKTEQSKQTPILLVGIISDTLIGKNKYVLKESVLEAAELMKAIRYIEVTTAADAKEVFLEASRVLVRTQLHETNVGRLLELNGKIQKANDKRPEVMLRKKMISVLPNSIFQVTSFLQRLRLDNNLFAYFPNEILHCPQLRELSLNSNQIEEVPSSISKLTLLSRFEIENNMLENLPIRALKAMSNLQEFKAGGNPLSKVPQEVFKGKNLKLELIQSFAGNIEHEQADTADSITVSEKEREPFPVFGIPLQQLMKNEYELFPHNPLPRIVRYSMSEIIKRAICLEGVFRMAGQAQRCAELRAEIDATTKISFSDQENPHNVTSILKQWLRGLPEPAMLFGNFDKVIKLGAATSEEQIKGLREILETLPRENFHLIRQMFRLMYLVGKNNEVNRMDFSNVAKVIGPNLAYSRDSANENPMDTINNVNFVNEFFTTLTESYPEVFEQDVDLFEVDYLQDVEMPNSILFRKLSGHSKSVNTATLSSDQRFLWTADTKGSFRIWDTDTTELVSSFETQSARINCMARVACNIWLGTAESIQIRNEETGDLVHHIVESPTFNIVAVNEDQLWTGNEIGGIYVYNADSFERETITLEGFVVLHMTQVADSVWGACTDRKIRVWNIATRECTQEIEIGDQGRLNAITWIGERVWGSFDNSSVVVWDSTTFEKLACLDEDHGAKVFGCTLVGDSVWTFSWDGQIHVYDKETFQHIEALPTYHSDAIGCIVCMEDPKLECQRVFTTSWDKTITVWLSQA